MDGKFIRTKCHRATKFHMDGLALLEGDEMSYRDNLPLKRSVSDSHPLHIHMDQHSICVLVPGSGSAFETQIRIQMSTTALKSCKEGTQHWLNSLFRGSSSMLIEHTNLSKMHSILTRFGSGSKSGSGSALTF
jgi:hypothetical protein